MLTSLFMAISDSYQKSTGKHNACIISAYLLTCCIETKFKSIALPADPTSRPVLSHLNSVLHKRVNSVMHSSRESTISIFYTFWLCAGRYTALAICLESKEEDISIDVWGGSFVSPLNQNLWYVFIRDTISHHWCNDWGSYCKGTQQGQLDNTLINLHTVSCPCGKP